MQQIGMDTVIIAESVDSTSAFYPTMINNFSEIGNQPIEKILNYADNNGMDVYIGLLSLDEWWDRIDVPFLDQLTISSQSIAAELFSLYSGHPSLKGLYISQEIDNMTWVDEYLRVRLVNRFLRPLSNQIKALSPSLIVCEAPFFNRNYQQPNEYETWWANTLGETPNLDLIIPQDGIGVEHATLAEMEDYFNALKSACISENRTIWSDLEIFERDGNHNVPASIDRISQQIETEAPLVSKIVCWEFSHHLSPAKSIATLDLYNNYARYLDNEDPLSLASQNESYTLSIVPSPSYPDAGGELTDNVADYSWDDQVGWWGESSISVILDLGVQTQNIANLRAYFMRSESSAVYLPSAISVSVSSNGVDYDYLCSLDQLIEEDSTIVPFQSILNSPVDGRYIKFDISCGGGWLMLCEVSVYVTTP